MNSIEKIYLGQLAQGVEFDGENIYLSKHLVNNEIKTNFSIRLFILNNSLYFRLYLYVHFSKKFFISS